MDKPASRRLGIPFGSGGRSLAYKLQSFLDLILRPVGEVLHHGHISKPSSETQTAWCIALFFALGNGRWGDRFSIGMKRRLCLLPEAES
jgi:hypothetical protein